jgi:ketosteroid isomerase-like protein
MTKLTTPRQIAESYWRAECAHDIPAILTHYHADAAFVPPRGERLIGHDQIRTFYEESFRRFVGLEVSIVHEISNDDEAALEWEAVFTDAAGKRYTLNGINVIRVSEGKFEEVRCYFDPDLLMG